MQNTKKIKFTIFICIAVVVALLVFSIVLLVNIKKAENKLYEQQQQIEQLQNTIDSYNNLPQDNSGNKITPNGD